MVGYDEIERYKLDTERKHLDVLYEAEPIDSRGHGIIKSGPLRLPCGPCLCLRLSLLCISVYLRDREGRADHESGERTHDVSAHRTEGRR